MEGMDLPEIRNKIYIVEGLTALFLILLTVACFADGVTKIDDSNIAVNKTVTINLKETQKLIKDYKSQVAMLQNAINNANAQINAFNATITDLQQQFLAAGIDTSAQVSQPVNP